MTQSEFVYGGILVVGQLLMFYLTRKQGKDLHVTLNSRLTEFVAAVKAAALLEGHAEGMKDERANPQVPKGDV